MKKYKIGMYGGKFMPLHKGHNYCIETACKECEKVYVILFYGGADELNILKNNKEEYLSVKDRIKHMKKICKKYDNAIPTLIDVTNCRLPNGEEDWDAETPLVRNVLGPELNAVYSSEPSYGPYFKRAYPEAEHRIVDYKRIKYPISGTQIRNMENEKERELWVI
jgi:HTH-type transcriptional repressor of NAD biosynthesis genes